MWQIIIKLIGIVIIFIGIGLWRGDSSQKRKFLKKIKTKKILTGTVLSKKDTDGWYEYEVKLPGEGTTVKAFGETNIDEGNTIFIEKNDVEGYSIVEQEERSTIVSVLFLIVGMAIMLI